jgi:hypothetical protein
MQDREQAQVLFIRRAGHLRRNNLAHTACITARHCRDGLRSGQVRSTIQRRNSPVKQREHAGARILLTAALGYA